MILREAKISDNPDNLENGRQNGKDNVHGEYKKLISLCDSCSVMIDRLFNPLDSTNRFINLALQSIEENSLIMKNLFIRKRNCHSAVFMTKIPGVWIGLKLCPG